MHKSLYDSFQHWYHTDGEHNNAIYLIGDPHFKDEDVWTFRNNNITDEEFVRRINSKVGKNDTLIILGDVGDIDVVKQLRGYKVLIQGNHDRGASRYKRDFVKLYTADHDKFPIQVDNKLFDEVYEGCLMIGDKIMLSHEPVDFPYAINIHGHTHGNYQEDELHICLCAERINYTPVCLKDIIESGILKNAQNIHRECIDRATERKQNKT